MSVSEGKTLSGLITANSLRGTYSEAAYFAGDVYCASIGDFEGSVSSTNSWSISISSLQADSLRSATRCGCGSLSITFTR